MGYYGESEAPREYVIFQRMDGNIIPGMNLRAVLTVTAALLVGVFLFAGLTCITRSAELPMGYEKYSEYQKSYTDMWSAVTYESLKATTPEEDWEVQLGQIRKVDLGDYTEDQVEALAAEAAEKGITAEMTSTEAAAMAPTTYEGTEPLIPGIYRVAISLIPAIVAVVLLFEVKGICLLREILQFDAWRKAEKLYIHGGSK